VVAGWRGLAVAGAFLLLEQYGAESTKAIFERPRPSRDLIAVAGNPSGFTFPSTTITFFCATFGAVAVLAARRRTARWRWPIFAVSAAMVALGCLARVALGAHWPSDVVLTTVICLAWIWAAARVVVPRS
jgi:undecaprenyl-diphosphatase